MIPVQKTPRELKEAFLDNHSKYKEVKDTNPSVGDFHTVTEDDEVWIMQCPKGTDVSALTGHKIKLPGRSNQDNLEMVAVEYNRPVSQAFGHKNRKGHSSIKILPIQGNIILRNRLKAMPLSEEAQPTNQSGRVPMPTGIKERHPLHGMDYVSRLEISPEIAERLKRADEITDTLSKKKSKSKNKSKEPRSIPVDSDGEVEIVVQKKAKKKKRKHSDDDNVILVESPKKKQKKTSLSDDVADDLKWIQKL